MARREGRDLGRARRAAPRTTSAARSSRPRPDEDAAQEAIDRAVEGSEKTFSERTYEDVDYQASARERGRASSRTSRSPAPSPSSSSTSTPSRATAWTRTTASARRPATLEDDRLGTFYFDVKTLIDQALREDPEAAQQLEQAKRLFPFDKLGPVAGAFLADGERLAIDTAADVPEGAAAGGLGALVGRQPTPLVGELPGEAWVAARLRRSSASR